jgi:hypothetical protein
MSKLKALVQWFVQLELREHGHWCTNEWITGRDEKRAACPHRGYRWSCYGVFCAGIERKDCPECKAWLRRANYATMVQSR